MNVQEMRGSLVRALAKNKAKYREAMEYGPNLRHTSYRAAQAARSKWRREVGLISMAIEILGRVKTDNIPLSTAGLEGYNRLAHVKGKVNCENNGKG